MEGFRLGLDAIDIDIDDQRSDQVFEFEQCHPLKFGLIDMVEVFRRGCENLVPDYSFPWSLLNSSSSSESRAARSSGS